MVSSPYLGWFGILRLGLIQTALGAIVVLTTSTINRVMVVELALPALLPGLLVGLHYAIQITRPRLGYGSDAGGRRTPWIIGGMLVLAVGGTLSAVATAYMADQLVAGIMLAVLAFVMVGLGVGAAGTSLLVLLASSVAPRYRGAAASTVWVMMIMGFILTAVIAGKQLDPFSLGRLIVVTASVSALAMLVTVIAIWGVESSVNARLRATVIAEATDHQRTGASPAPDSKALHSNAPDSNAPDFNVRTDSFMTTLKGVWSEAEARRFSIFVFVSMLAYSAQDLVLEPFAGAVFGMTPGQSTQLSGTQHGGVLCGMLLVALSTSLIGGKRLGSLRFWTIGGCVLSAVMLAALAIGGHMVRQFPLPAFVFCLGVANGAFAVAAIGSMMDLVGRGAKRREGTRMGVWGAAQAMAFGLGGILATSLVDVSKSILGDPVMAYTVVFTLQAVLFLLAARLASGVYRPAAAERSGHFSPGEIALELER